VKEKDPHAADSFDAGNAGFLLLQNSAWSKETQNEGEPMAISIRSIKGLRVLCWITVVNVLISGGYSLAGLIDPQSVLPGADPPTHASFVFAAYAAARSIPLVLVVLFAIYKRMTVAILALGALAGTIQTCDFIVGLIQGDGNKVVGPLILAIVQFYAVAVVSRSLASSPDTNRVHPPEPDVV